MRPMTSSAKQSRLPAPHPEERGTRVSKDEGPAGGLALRDARQWRAPQGEDLSLFAMTTTTTGVIPGRASARTRNLAPKAPDSGSVLRTVRNDNELKRR